MTAMTALQRHYHTRSIHAEVTAPTATDSGPIRVSFMIDDLSRAGTESQLLALIDNLPRELVEPRLVLLNGLGEESQQLEPENCPVIRLGIRKLAAPAAFGAAKRLLRFWREFPTDILQCYFMDSAYFGLPLARLSGIPTRVRVRNNLGYTQTRKHRWLSRTIAPFVTEWLSNTEQGKQAIAELDGVEPSIIHVIENGVDLERFPFDVTLERLKVLNTTKPLVLGCVANLRTVKNLDGLIRAVRLLRDRHHPVSLRIAGEGDCRAELEHLRAELDLQQAVELCGPINNVPQFLRGVDVAVLPSHSEGMSNALLEYMAAGRAIVATPIGASTQLIQHRMNGLLSENTSPAALAEAIELYCKQPNLRLAYGCAARHTVEQNHSRAAMVQRFLSYYQRLHALTAQQPS